MEKRNQLIKKLSLSKQVTFLKRLTDLLESGIPIVEALTILATFMDKKLMHKMREACQLGYSFSEILKIHQFDKQVIYIVSASENHNALFKGLKSASLFASNYATHKKEFGKKIRYPLLLFSLVMLIVAAVFVFFIPRLDDFYQTFGLEGQNLPVVTILLTIGTFFIILVLTTLMIMFVLFVKDEVKQRLYRQRLFNPKRNKKLVPRLFTYYFASRLEMLLNSGVSLKDSMSTIENFENIPFMKEIFKEIHEEMKSGQPVEKVISTLPYFTPYFKLIVNHATKVGKFVDELSLFVDTELKTLNHGMTILFKVLQGFFLMLVGGLIISLYLSILMPVFHLIDIL